jgi:hypothetical protein
MHWKGADQSPGREQDGVVGALMPHRRDETSGTACVTALGRSGSGYLVIRKITKTLNEITTAVSE